MKSLFFAVAALCFFWMVGVTRADDHGDTRQTATTITARDTAGNLDTAQDEDWFRIVITQAGRVWIYSTGNTDTRGFLYTDAGAYIDQDDESGAGGTGSNFLFNRVFQPGTYYLRVDDGGTGNLTGPYTVSIRSPENSIAFAPAVTPNLDANLDVLGDHDYYRIDIARAGRVWIYTTGNADTRGFLYTDAGAYIDQDDESGAGGTGSNFLLNRVLQPGSYYLLVDDGGTGNLTGAYTLSVRTIENATLLASPNLDASLGVLGDLDLYRIDITQPGPAWFFTTGTTDARGTLYTDAGTYIDQDDESGAGFNFLFNRVVQPGTYYLLVEGGGSGNLTGNYTLSIRNRTYCIPLFGNGSSSHSIEVLGDLDLFVFSSTGGSVKFLTTGGTDTFGTIYDSGGNFVANDSDAGDGSNFLITDELIPGEYFLLVRGQTLDAVTGNYGLTSIYTSGPLVREGPDGLVGFSASNLIGSEIYNTTGTGQTVTKTVSRGSSKTALIVVQNDATVTTSFSVSGTPGKPGFKVRYYADATEITDAVVAGTYTIADLPPGQSVMLKAKVVVKSGAVPGSKIKCAVTATSLASPTLQDTVQVKIFAR